MATSLADSGALPLRVPVSPTARLTAPGAGWWVRHLEATGRVWATVLPLGGAGALVELRARARPRPLVALLRTDADCRAALDALTAPGALLGDPAAALPVGLRVTPDVWRARAVSGGPPVARGPVPRPPVPPASRPTPGAPPSSPRIRRPRRHRPESDRDGGTAGRELRRRREAAGLGQRAAAARLHVSRGYLDAIERGRRDGPGARVVAAAGLALLGAPVVTSGR